MKNEDSYKNPSRTSKKYIEKRERTEFERAIKEWLCEVKTTNFLLMSIAMILIGIFVRLVFG